MKKNQKTYLLLTVVLVIWGILGFKLLGALGSDDEMAETVHVSDSYISPATKKREPLEIAANYRDPFFGTMPKTEQPKKKKVVKKPKPQIPRKNIVYSGSVAQNGAKDRLYFVSINGQQHIMEKNQKINDVTLVWGDTESIKIKYPGHRETIKLHN